VAMVMNCVLAATWALLSLLDFRRFSRGSERVSEEVGDRGRISSRSGGPQALGEKDLVDEIAAESLQFGA